jgi:predicted phosphodiesterase
MNVDYLSDIHIDFWVNPQAPEFVQSKKIEEFITPFIPTNPSNILIIPGDIGHSNDQNILLFEILKKTYKYILYVEGNHDLYLILPGQKQQYQNDSFLRLREMIDLSSKIEGVYYLSGFMEIEGVKIGGFPMWYDNSYGLEVCARSPIFINQLWKQWMADSRFIFTHDSKYPHMDWLTYAASQKQILEASYKDCRVIFSHVSPDWSHLKPQYQGDPTSTFFHFDGREILKNCKGKTWVHGHTHLLYDEYTEGCHILCNPLGYPSELGQFGERDIESFKIRTFEV